MKRKMERVHVTSKPQIDAILKGTPITAEDRKKIVKESKMMHRAVLRGEFTDITDKNL